jgi:hypothetical protein
MFPQSFSFYEAYGKHRSPEEIGNNDRQNQSMQSRNELYGDPVNTLERPKFDSPANWEKKQYKLKRKPVNGFFLFRPFTFFFSLFSSR